MSGKFWFILFFISFLAIECLGDEQTFTLNPDGSGKVDIRANLYLDSFLFDYPSNPRQKMIAKVKSVLGKSRGVDTWRDVEYKINTSGNIFFSATAYFQNIENIQLEGIDAYPFSFKKNIEGKLILQLKQDASDISEEKTNWGSDIPPKNTNRKPLEDKVFEFLLGQMLTADILLEFNRLDITMKFYLPGRILQTSNFIRNPDDSLSLRIRGPKLMQAIDTKHGKKQGNELGSVDPNLPSPKIDGRLEFSKILFGERALVCAIIKSDFKPLFNYQKEVKEARENFNHTIAQLGLLMPEFLDKAHANILKETKVTNIKIVQQQSDVFSPGATKKYLQVDMECMLQQPIKNVTGGMIDLAIGDDQVSLLYEPEGQRIWPKLLKDGSSVTFSFALNLPKDNVRSIREMSGSLNCILAYGVKNVDIGIVDFKLEAKNKHTQVKIEMLDQSYEAGFKQDLVFSFPIQKYHFKNFSILSLQGKKCESNLRMTYWFNGRQMVECYAREKLPPKGRIIVESYEGLRKYKIPFRIFNILLNKYLSVNN